MTRNVKSLFNDKSSLVLREMLSDREYKWTVRMLAKTLNVSTGLVSRVINILDKLGFVERVERGRHGYVRLKNSEGLLKLWIQQYSIYKNKTHSYFLPSKASFKKVVGFLKDKKIKYAMTLHFAANCITGYFPFDEYHIYICDADIRKLAENLSSLISIKRLTRGGNLHFLKPYYKNAVFHRAQNMSGLVFVSNLQLYLDLYHYCPRGSEHADYLKSLLGEKIYE